MDEIKYTTSDSLYILINKLSSNDNQHIRENLRHHDTLKKRKTTYGFERFEMISEPGNLLKG